MELDGSNSDIHIFGKDGDMCSPLENDSERDVLSKQNVDRDKVFSLTSSSLNVSLEHEIRDKVVQELQAPTKEFHDLRSSARQVVCVVTFYCTEPLSTLCFPVFSFLNNILSREVSS